MPPTLSRSAVSAETLARRFDEVRAFSRQLTEPLAVEDQVVQSMPDVSPTKWHLAHVTWFFETFVLKAHVANYRSPDERFEYLFNSYYNTVGAQYPRARRGLITRPTVDEVWTYRLHVDAALRALLQRGTTPEVAAVIELGLHHEQQHQELLLMDIKHVLSCNPLFPAYDRLPDPTAATPAEPTWSAHAGGVHEIGHAPDGGFAFDNEAPRHRVWLEPFELASRLVTNREYLAFIDDGGYRRPELWLADGWATVGTEGWNAPGYWQQRDGGWHEFTLGGLRPLALDHPVAHVSYYEADAFARWSGSRLPAEAEWEVVAAALPLRGHFVECGALHPQPASGSAPTQLFGDLWEWTCSPYAPYPGFAPATGALGEYNGKFMCNQFVLRGGACVTAQTHLRATYRNFYYPHQRWQFSGIRLAR